MASPKDLARQLRLHRHRLLKQDAFAAEEPIVEWETMPFPLTDQAFEQEERQAGELVAALDRALREENWSLPTAEALIDGFGGDYLYGLIPRRAPMREIVRGFVRPVRYMPLVGRVPDRVALYLRFMLPGGDDGIEREEHGGVKWHFHYIDARYRRSDVILSFDTRWEVAKSAKELDRLRPLFVERHAEGKAKFTARPGQWETEKRISMYEICSRDLQKGIEHFRCAKNGSDAVWPRNATLTPHPSSLAKTGTTAGSGKIAPSGR